MSSDEEVSSVESNDGFGDVQPDPESDDDDGESGTRFTIRFEKPDGPIGEYKYQSTFFLHILIISQIIN